MASSISLSARDRSILAFLDRSVATAALVLDLSTTFDEPPFRDERRTRERMQALSAAGLVQSFPTALTGGGQQHYYRLTPSGYREVYGADAQPSRWRVSELAPSRIRHALRTAEVMVHTLVASHAARVRVAQYHGDGQLTLEVGSQRLQPDAHFQLEQSGRFFNLLFEVDNATEPIVSSRPQSIETKLRGYERYQDWVLQGWRSSASPQPRPAFRVVFLTTGVERVRHILWLARRCARNPDRRLIYAATLDEFLGEPRAVTQPLHLDHHGEWRALVDLHPAARFLRAPVRCTPPPSVGAPSEMDLRSGESLV